METHQKGEAGHQQGVGAELRAQQAHAGQGQGVAEGAQRQQEQARKQEDPAWAVEKKEAQGAPTIPERPQVRAVALAAVGVQGDGYLGDAGALHARANDHFRGEFHAGAALLEFVVMAARETPHAAVNVTDGKLEHHSGQAREKRVSQPAMKEGHGAGHDPPAAAGQAATLYQVVARPQLFDELGDFAKIVAVVGVAHDDEATSGCRDPRHQRISVASFRHVDHPGAPSLGDARGAVLAAIIGHDDFARTSALLEGGLGFADTGGKSLRLVEAGHDDAQFDCRKVVLLHLERILPYAEGVCWRGRGYGSSRGFVYDPRRDDDRFRPERSRRPLPLGARSGGGRGGLYR